MKRVLSFIVLVALLGLTAIPVLAAENSVTIKRDSLYLLGLHVDTNVHSDGC